MNRRQRDVYSGNIDVDSGNIAAAQTPPRTQIPGRANVLRLEMAEAIGAKTAPVFSAEGDVGSRGTKKLHARCHCPLSRTKNRRLKAQHFRVSKGNDVVDYVAFRVCFDTVASTQDNRPFCWNLAMQAVR